MIIRDALITDIAVMHIIRCSVNENKLSDPSVVNESHYHQYLKEKGKGWVCEIDGKLAGFAIAGLREKNVWALFVDPLHERKGIGRSLHDVMLNWYFDKHNDSIWLSTAPGTRAEAFYRKAGWTQTGMTKSGEIRFEMTSRDWKTDKS